MNRSKRISVALALLGALTVAFTWSIPAHADNVYASIRGTVTDPSGAVMQDVKVTASDLGTGISYNATTNKDGAYAFLQLPIGSYAVKTETSGFKPFQTTGIKLNLNQVYALNIKLEVGSLNQEILVEANPVQVESTDMQLGTTVTGNQIVDIPLNGRAWVNLTQLEPGVIGQSDRFGANQAYSTNGAESQQNSFLINGTDSNDASINVPLYNPSPDAIGEFRLVTNTINPEYGRNSGAIINAVIKNGTNQFHGDLFEFYRDTFLDAKSWFEVHPTPFHQNEFGGTIGGPIVKNHAFFFFSYQGNRSVAPEGFPNSIIPVVFSPAERTGDFSEATSGGPFTPPSASKGVSPIPMLGADGATHPAGTPYATLFPTGNIPTADLNPLAVKVMNQYVPLPNAPGNKYLFNPIINNDDNQYIYRIDEKIRDKDSLWYYGLYESFPFSETLAFNTTNLPGFPDRNPEKWYGDTVAWNHILSSTTLNEARFAFLRFNYTAIQPLQTVDPSAYGFTGIHPQFPQFESLPVMDVAGLFTVGFSTQGPQPRVQNTYQVTDNFSKVSGHHALKFGFNMDRIELNNPYLSSLNGGYTYNGSGLFSTGNPGADFLLGIPDSFTQGSGSTLRARMREYYSYAQDQWQVKRNVTLTLGVGWDIETPVKNLYANGEAQSAFIAGEQSKIFPTAPVGYVFPGDPGVSAYGGPTVHYGDFGPRVGFAWSPGTSGNWSIRAGIGLYFNRTEMETALQALSNAPFALGSAGAGAAPLFSSPNFANPYASINTTAVAGVASGITPNPFPGFVAPSPGSAVNFTPYEPIGFSANTIDPHVTAPRSTNYNLTIQRQISKSTIASLGYVGNVARHLEGGYNLNPANPAIALKDGCTSDFALTNCPNAFQYPSIVPTIGQIGVFATAFNSNYNSLQASVNRRFSDGLQFLVSYTWSRYFDYTSNYEGNAFTGPGIDPLEVRKMYGPSANDAPQRLVVSYTYTLPFYKFTHKWRRLTDDWNLVGIYTLQHGLPVTVYNEFADDLIVDPFLNYYGGALPTFTSRTSMPLGISDPRQVRTFGGTTANYWFNPGAFTDPGPGVLGNANRNPLYGPGINYGDLALEKSVHIDESKYVQLRLETFNTFNHANFANPNGLFGTPTFGQILGVQTLTTNGDGRVLQLGAKFYF